MRIAVYTISKNEEQFVSRFMKPLKEADMVIITDTGSTDNSVESLRDHGAIVHETKLDPWRFDVPRRVSLNFVPKDVDVCVCIDLDEVLTDGWRDAIERAWTPQTTRLRYPYIWSTLPDGSPGVTFWYDKIHKRSGYRWVKPVHEVLNYYEGQEVQTYCDEFKLFHYPDHSKSRGNYLPLLELGCKEQPEDDRNSHYLGREYMFYHMYDKSITELQRHLSLNSAKWNAERSASMRYIARCYSFKKDFINAELWGMKACAEAPGEREPWVELGKIYYSNGNFSGAYYAMKKAISIEERPMTYICEPESWGSLPYDIASIAAFNLGIKSEAISLCKKAIELSRLSDPRLQNNLLQIQSKL